MATIHKPFVYIPALHTNVAKTIAKEKKRLKDLEEAKAEAMKNVANINPQRKAHG